MILRMNSSDTVSPPDNAVVVVILRYHIGDVRDVFGVRAVCGVDEKFNQIGRADNFHFARRRVPNFEGLSRNVVGLIRRARSLLADVEQRDGVIVAVGGGIGDVRDESFIGGGRGALAEAVERDFLNDAVDKLPSKFPLMLNDTEYERATCSPPEGVACYVF